MKSLNGEDTLIVASVFLDSSLNIKKDYGSTPMIQIIGTFTDIGSILNQIIDTFGKEAVIEHIGGRS